MADEIIFAVEESPEGGYEARALSAPIFTEADSLVDLRTMVRDAVECHFEEKERPQAATRMRIGPRIVRSSSSSCLLVIRLHFVRDELIAV